MEIENDPDIGTRVFECSSKNSCYNQSLKIFDNTLCNEYESCGKWFTDDLFEGCILNKFCGVKALYTHDDPTTYECPNGQKSEPLLVVEANKAHQKDLDEYNSLKLQRQ